jgi:hypothetical protein
MKNKYNVSLAIIILSILLIDIFSGSLGITKDIENLIIGILFAAGSLIILFSLEIRIFVLMNILGFIQLNLGLSTNYLFQSGMISSQIAYNLLIAKWVLTIITFILIILGFYDRISLKYWKEKIVLSKQKTIVYYLLGTIILQSIIHWC